MLPKAHGELTSTWKIAQHLDIKEIQIKIITRYAYIYIRIAKIIKTDYTWSEHVCEATGNLNHRWYDAVILENSLNFFLNVKHVPVILLPAIYSQPFYSQAFTDDKQTLCSYKNLYINFTAALFLRIVSNANAHQQNNDKLWYIHTREYYSA